MEITKGEFEAQKYAEKIETKFWECKVYSIEGGGVVKYLYVKVFGDSKEEAEANAQLTAEAFNVANETGFSPRQLAEQNKILKNTLIHIKEIQKTFGVDSSNRKIIRLEEWDWKLINDALKQSK